jgi:acetylornithine deacetylase/succinyl-diaminopimelate desuccinylase-like protein
MDVGDNGQSHGKIVTDGSSGGEGNEDRDTPFEEDPVYSFFRSKSSDARRTVMLPAAVIERIDSDRNCYEAQLMEFLRIPSVSTLPTHRGEVRQAAEWVLDQLRALGFQGELAETQGHPVVFAQRCPHGNRPTVLIYGHYDVQPTDPDPEWVSPPFAPSVRDGFVYARGASDDKGQLLTHLKALEAILKADGEIPVNVRVLMEGEEEIGSPSLGPFIQERRRDLRADVVVISDGSQFARGVPAITYGLRGLSYLQVDVGGPRFDLHSGGFGGLVANPAQVLAQILVRLTNPDGSVAIPGFYDTVSPLDAREREEMARLPFDEEALRSYLGVDRLVGEAGYAPLERKTARPTLDVNGIWGGFSGEGAKTIIPAKAGAKVSMRLVPNQDPKEINRLFKEFVQSVAPPGVQLQIKDLHGADPVLVDRNHPGIQAAARAIQIGFGKPPVFIREGGSIPVVNLFKNVLGVDGILLLGWGSPDDGAHSPNERMNLEDFHRGIRTAAALLYEMSGTGIF